MEVDTDYVHTLEMNNGLMLKALRIASNWFGGYADMHEKKGNLYKAMINISKQSHLLDVIKVVEENIDDEVCEGIPNRTYTETTIFTDENEQPVTVERIHTWRTWRDDSHQLGDSIEGYYYFMSATFGQTLTSHELMLIHNSANVELVDEIPTYNNGVL